MTTSSLVKAMVTVFSLLTVASSPLARQSVNQDADILVAQPAYTKQHPKVLFDEAHFNVHTGAGRSEALAQLITNDGYSVLPNKVKFRRESLGGSDVLVIISALGADREIRPEEAGNPAFTERECDVVQDWVRGGGGLLLVTDHEPTGAAAQNLAKRFGVEMSNATTMDSSPTNHMTGCSGCILFTRENGLLVDHSITQGRGAQERIRGVDNGVGTSAKGPDGSTAFLRLADTAYDQSADGRKISAAGRAQGIAFKFGKGRVVVLAEAAMIAGQGPRPGQNFRRWGLNRPGIDNRQLALNIVHWLSGLLN